MKKVYVFGHRNPDADSVCSAIAYAHLKNRMDDRHDYIPVVLGEINKETKYILENTGVKVPDLIRSLKPQVSDLKLEQVDYVNEGDSVKAALEKIIGNIGRSIPVVGRSGNFVGVVSISDLMPMVMKPRGDSFLKDNGTSYGNLIDGLDLEHVWGPVVRGRITGSVNFVSDINNMDWIDSKSVLICDKGIYPAIMRETEVCSCIIVYGVESLEVKRGLIETAETNGCTMPVYITVKGMMEVAQSIQYSARIMHRVTKSNLEYFTTYETLEDVKKNMLTSKFRRFPVVDEKGQIRGMISKSNLLEYNRKKVILVDHNEKKQSIEEIDDVTLMEVIDHHRVADVNTVQPLYFRVEPVGSTATVIAKMYEENDMEMDTATAKLILSAIYSDTLLFKSPTTTLQDRYVASRLEAKTGYSEDGYGLAMIRAGSELYGISAERVCKGDLKRFMFGDYSVAISQRNTSDFDGFHQIYSEVFELMKAYCDTQKVQLFVMMITDIISGGSEIIALGSAKWIADNAFGLTADEHTIFKEGVFSRKKQVVPLLMKAAKL